MMLKLFSVLMFIAMVHSTKFNNTSRHKGKAFSLFSIVQFPNDVCTSSSSSFPVGTCLASSECTGKDGTAMGNCAAGFGVCCVFSSSTCGSTISQNCTYITNPGFPSTYSTTGECKWTVNKCSDDVCQIRLDFDAFAQNIYSAAASYGCCGSSCTITTDSFTAKGQTGVNPPVICGINTGYHMYLEVGTTNTDTASLDMYLSQTGNRQWNIKVTQISCSANWRVAAGCTQYFTGISNKVASYAHQSAQLLQSQNYNNCVRREAGYCSMQWREAGQSGLGGTATASPDPFQFPDAAIATQALNSACPNAFVYISNGNLGGSSTTATYLSNTFCGDALNCDACQATITSPAGRPIPAYTESFNLGVFSNAAARTDKAASAATGFNLRYTQEVCS